MTSPLPVSDLFSVEGKVAIVTGGSRGIGAMIARGLVSNGAIVYITARKAEACDAMATELNELGTCHSVPSDLSTEEGRAAVVDRIAADGNKLDILVNNAGAAWGAPLGEFPEVGFEKVMNINVAAPFLLTQSLLPQLRESASAEDPSRVIMIGSIDGIRVPFGDNYSYSASKAGIHMLARHLAHHIVKDHITVNSIAPGPFESKMMSYMLDDPASREMVEKSVPRGRIGSPEDVAGTVLYLSSRAGAFVTGAVIPLDGEVRHTVDIEPPPAIHPLLLRVFSASWKDRFRIVTNVSRYEQALPKGWVGSATVEAHAKGPWHKLMPLSRASGRSNREADESRSR